MQPGTNPKGGAARPRLTTHRNGVVSINRGLIAETGVIPAGMRFIRDTHSFTPLSAQKGLMEGRGGKEVSVFKVTGLFQEADKENANGRVYPREVLAEAVKLVQEDVDRRSVMGEFDHPPDAKIHLDRVSHLLTKVWMEGKKVYGEAQILDSQPMGRCLRGLFEQKVQVGISSRGVGDMEVRESDGQEYYEVLPGYAFVTWDAVAEPSVHGATLRIMEGLQARTRPIHRSHSKGELSRAAYERELLREIDRYFGLK